MRAYAERVVSLLEPPTDACLASALTALGRFPTTQAAGQPPSVKTMDVFGAAPASLKLPLNRKTTANDVQAVSLDRLEPSQEFIPVAGLAAYISHSRRDCPDVAHVIHRDGRERWVIQEGHTRLGAAKLRGEPTKDARVWEFMEGPTGAWEPVPRGLHKRGLTYRDKLRSLHKDRDEYPGHLYPSERGESSPGRADQFEHDVIRPGAGEQKLNLPVANGVKGDACSGFGRCTVNALKQAKRDGSAVYVGTAVRADRYAEAKQAYDTDGTRLGTEAFPHAWNVKDGHIVDKSLGSEEAAKHVYFGKRVPEAVVSQLEGDGDALARWHSAQRHALSTSLDEMGLWLHKDRSEYPDNLYPSERDDAASSRHERAPALDRPEHEGSWPVASGTVRTKEMGKAECVRLAAETAPVLRALTKEEGDAVYAYTGSGYVEINEKLRDPAYTNSNTDALVASQIRRIDRAIEKAKDVKPPPVVWRAVGVQAAEALADVQPGDTLELKGYQSTTLRPDIAGEWTGGHQVSPSYLSKKNTVLEIQPKNGLYVDQLSINQGEAEYLLPHNQSYEVVGVSDEPFQAEGLPARTRRVVKLRQVGDVQR